MVAPNVTRLENLTKFDAQLHTDEEFRNRQDESHHKDRSPFERLNIDMVKDFPVADSLHLLDIGVMKKCILIWLRGTKDFKTKFSKQDVDMLNKMLKECKGRMPSDLHRSVRTINCISLWKAVEFRHFLLYLGIVVLKKILPKEIYEHFLLLFGVVTILSSKKYIMNYSSIAKAMLASYLEGYVKYYGVGSITSNVHNLCHIIDDCERFGPLQTLSTYPFENMLFNIKQLIRTGNRQLAQIGKRTLERSGINLSYVEKKT